MDLKVINSKGHYEIARDVEMCSAINGNLMMWFTPHKPKYGPHGEAIEDARFDSTVIKDIVSIGLVE